MYSENGIAITLTEKREIVNARLENEPFTEKYSEYYKKEFQIEYILLGSKINSVGKLIYDNGIYKIMEL